MPTTSVRDAGSLTPDQVVAVKQELDMLLRSEQFSGAKRCHDFLKFVVNTALTEDYENLTERILGAELFGRPIDYETGSDAIVRVRANDVRRRLAEYYSEKHPVSRICISLPCGTYIPEFHWSEPAASEVPADSANASSLSGGEAVTTSAAAAESRSVSE